MKNKKSFLILALAMAVLIGGAGLFYTRLGDDYAMPRLAVNENAVAHAEPGEKAEAAETAATASANTDEATELAATTETGETTEPAEAAEAAEPTGSEEQAAPETAVDLAPDFTVTDAGGNPVQLSDYRGKPVVLNFWASWCGPCQSEMPDFQIAYNEHGGDVEFLMVNLTDGGQETMQSAVRFVEENGYSFPVLFDTQGSAAIAYGVSSIPSTYFIGADGSAVAMGRGALDLATLESGIGMLLGTN